MKTEVERLEEKDTLLLRVEVPADVFSKEIEQAYKRIAGQLVIPGFRKGKIPKAIIDSRVGKQAVQEEAVHQALPNYYGEALQETDVEPIDQPDIDIVQLDSDKPFIFTAKVRIMPEVVLGKYKGVEVEKPSVEATEEEIDNQIDALRNNFANLQPVEDRAVQEGDFALIDFEGFIEDTPFEGGSAQDYLLEVGSGTFIPGFEEQVVGMKKGETKDVTVTFPETYGSEQLAGKEAKFRVSVKEIKEKKLPEVTDDFAKQVGFDTVEELRVDIKNKIHDVKVKHADTEVRGRVVDAVTDTSEVEIADVLVERELDDMIEDFAHDVQQQGLSLEQYLKLTGTTTEKLREDWRERAEHRVRSRLVVEAIAKAENIEVSDEDVDNEVRKAAEATGRDFEEVKQIFGMKGTLGTLRKRIMTSKAIDWLIANADIKDETVEETVSETKEAKKETKKKEPKEETKGKTKAKDTKETKEAKETKEKAKEDTTVEAQGEAKE